MFVALTVLGFVDCNALFLKKKKKRYRTIAHAPAFPIDQNPRVVVLVMHKPNNTIEPVSRKYS